VKLATEEEYCEQRLTSPHKPCSLHIAPSDPVLEGFLRRRNDAINNVGPHARMDVGGTNIVVVVVIASTVFTQSGNASTPHND